MCRYGHQDVYRILGRDPAREPLTIAEMQLFEQALLEHVQAERRASPDPLSAPSE